MSSRILDCCGGFGVPGPDAEHLHGCPDEFRYRSPLGDQRDHSVECCNCYRPGVLALDSVCEPCHQRALHPLPDPYGEQRRKDQTALDEWNKECEVGA